MDDIRRGPRLREQLRAIIRTRRYSHRTEQAYWYWIRYFVKFHDLRHPAEMAEREVREFLSWLALDRKVAASTQNQALNALVFLYARVLEKPLGDIGSAVRAKRPPRLPVVLSHDEAMAIIGELESPYRLMASLMYGSGLRLVECARLRIKVRSDIRTIQELLGHSDLRTTQIYTHVLGQRFAGVRSPINAR